MNGNVVDLIHSATMSVGQPASVEGTERHRGARSPYNFQRAEFAAAKREPSGRVLRQVQVERARLSAGRNGRESRLCDGAANPNAPESKPNTRGRRSSLVHVYNKAGHHQ